VAIPGKDPNKIRSEHPTVLVIDEAAFIENGGDILVEKVLKRCCHFVPLTKLRW
jgi:hypothetical protein